MLSTNFRKGLLLVVLVGLFSLLIGCSAPAQAGGGEAARSAATNGGDLAYTINVNGSGTASGTPDVVDIRLGVEATNADAAQAIAENTTNMKAVLAAIEALGIEDKDIQTVNYNMWVEHTRNPETGEPTGQMRYHVSNQVNIRLHDVTLAGQLLEDALAAGANNVDSIAFSVDDSTELQKQARAIAIQDARAKADELAAGLGIQVGKVRQVNEYVSGHNPIPMPMMAEGRGGGGEVPIASGSFNVTVEVQIVFDIIQ